MLDIQPPNQMNTCYRCGIQFQPKHKSIGKYCSVECHNKYQKEHKINNRKWETSRYIPINLICKTCEKTFNATRGMKYCSKKCQSIMATIKKSIDRKPQKFNCICIQCDNKFTNHYLTTFCCNKCKNTYKKTHATKHIGNGTCINCGIDFNKKSCNAAQKFCTRNCYWEYRRQHPEEKIQKNHLVSTKVDKVCIVCQKSFSVHPYRKTANFCSKTCHYNHRRNVKICRKCNVSFQTPKHVDAEYCCIECASKGSDVRRSKLSKTISEILDCNNVKYQIESPIKSTDRTVWVDFMIDDKIVIEANGDYWHCNPSIYSKTYYHTQIQKTAEQIWKYDSDRKKFIESKGYFCIFVWESELYDPNLSNRLLNAVKEIRCDLHKLQK